MKTRQANLRVVLILLCSFLASQVNAQSNAEDIQLARAKQLWELAIMAKGGRDALYKIHAIAQIHDDKGKSITLVVLPDKYFSWFDARPGQFGLDIKLYNFESGFGYRHSGLFGARLYSDIRTHSDFSLVKGRLTDLMYSQLFLLLETRWMQPKPIVALKDRVNGKSVDRVDVLIEGYGPPERFAIYLDEKTHLPVRIAMCRTVNSQEISDFCCFSNKRAYVDMAGVKIPIESSGKNTPWGRDKIELNPEYDPQFFDRPPDHNAGGLQWRKAGAQPAPHTVTPELTTLTSGQITQLIKDLGSTDEEIRQAAVRDLATAGKQVVPALTEALSSSSNNPLRRYNLAVVLLKLDEQNQAATAALTDLVVDVRLNMQTRQDAAFGLLRSEAGIAMLTGLLSHSDPFVRRCVVFAFDELTERAIIPPQVEKAIPALRELTRDKDEVIRKMAKEVLQQIGNRFKH